MHAIAAALTVLLLTAPSSDSSNDVSIPAVTKAARESLGADTQIVVRQVAAFPSDDAAAVLGVELHADALVEVKWQNPDSPSAIIRLMRSKSGRWVDRELTFRAIDAPTERGRTIGFTIASMVPEHPPEPPAPPAPRVPEPTPRPPEAESPPELAPKPNAKYPRLIDAMGIAGLGVGDAGGGVGGALGFRLRATPTLAFRLGAGVRVGRVAPAETTTWFFSGVAGIAWDAWASRNGRRSLGLRLDGLLVRQEFAHLSSDDPNTIYRGKWLPGADLLVEVTWFFTDGVALAASAGAEGVVGQTDIIVRGQRVTTLQPIRPVLELGLRARF